MRVYIFFSICVFYNTVGLLARRQSLKIDSSFNVRLGYFGHTDKEMHQT